MGEPHHYQLDIPYAGPKFMNIPKIMPGRINTDDFVYFKWPRHFNPNLYNVLIEPNDTAGTRFRNLGGLIVNGMTPGMVPLPSVYFNAESKIGVVPINDSRLPSFWSRLNRASTYDIPDVDSRRGGAWPMVRHGILTAAVDSFQ